MKLPERTLRSSWLLAFALLCAGTDTRAQPQPLEGTWAAGPHHLGDRVVLTVGIPVPEAKYFVTGALAPGTFWGDTRVAAAEQVPPTSVPGELTYRVTVQPFTVGPARLTPVPMTVNTDKGPVEYLLSPPSLEVAPLLGEDAAPPPPAPPLPYPRPFPWALLLSALAASGLLALLALWLRARRRAGILSRPPAPKLQEADPDRWIREEVERIFRTEAEPRIKYGKISQRVREYLHLKTELPFPEWTTEECARGASRSPLLGEAELGALAEGLRLCDLAKFARYSPPAGEEEGARKGILLLLDGVRRNAEAARAAAAKREGAA